MIINYHIYRVFITNLTNEFMRTMSPIIHCFDDGVLDRSSIQYLLPFDIFECLVYYWFRDFTNRISRGSDVEIRYDVVNNRMNNIFQLSLFIK